MRSCYWLVALSVLLLAGCSPMEYQSDMPDKKPLPVLENNFSVHKKWSDSAGNGVGDKDIKLQLAQSGTTLFTVDYVGKVQATNAVTGAQLWRVDVDEAISAGPAVGEGKLVVGTNTGKVLAVDIETGKLAWSSMTTSEVLAAPKIASGMVFVHTMDGGLSALSLSDGRQLWRFTHNLPPLVLRRSSTPIVSANNVIAGFSSGKIISLSKLEGTVNWSQDIAHPHGNTDLQRMVDISADPVLKDNTIYAASYQGALAALDISNGHVNWNRDLSSYAGLAADNKLIYVSATNGDVVAVDIKTGATFWLQSALQGRILSKPAIMDKYIVLGDDDGYIHWLDKNSGNLLGRYQLDKNGVEATPVIHNNIVYILGRSGKLVALEVN